MKATPSKPVQEIEMIVEYFDKTVDSIFITYNLGELEKLVSSSFGTGASMNFHQRLRRFLSILDG